jgi:hypothetical protein
MSERRLPAGANGGEHNEHNDHLSHLYSARVSCHGLDPLEVTFDDRHALKAQIPIRTWVEWARSCPGSRRSTWSPPKGGHSTAGFSVHADRDRHRDRLDRQSLGQEQDGHLGFRGHRPSASNRRRRFGVRQRMSYSGGFGVKQRPGGAMRQPPPGFLLSCPECFRVPPYASRTSPKLTGSSGGRIRLPRSSKQQPCG